MFVPAVYDDAGLIDNDEKLMETLTEYYSVTGICPVIYTTYDEVWNGSDPASTDSYADLETYAFCTYTDNFSDEQHFVIVYSIPEADAEALKEGRITVPDYSWEAVQGDDTDPLITEGFFRAFARRIQKDLESGLGPGETFDNAFVFALRDAEDTLKPFSLGNIINMAKNIVPVLIVAGFIVPMLVISIKRYIRDRDVEYEEVPLESDDISSVSGVSSGTAYSGSYSSATAAISRNGPVVVSIVSLVFIVPFIFVGLGITAFGGILLSQGESYGGTFLLIFGILWTILSAVPTIKVISALLKKKKESAEETSLTAEYPKAEYPKVNYPQANYPQADIPDADYPDIDKDYSSVVPNPFVPLNSRPAPSDNKPDQPAPSSPFVPLKDKPEFDPQFFGSAKSDIEEDDEDYKRMKRKGFE